MPAAARADGIDKAHGIERIDGAERLPEVDGKFAFTGPAAEPVRGVAPASTPGTDAPQLDTRGVGQAVSARPVLPIVASANVVRQDIASRVPDSGLEAGAVREVRASALEPGESGALRQFAGRVFPELALGEKLPALPVELRDNVETTLGRSNPQVQSQGPVSGLGATLAAAYTDAGAAKAGHLPAINVAPQDPAFGDQLAGRVTMMVRDGQSEARVQLNPPELGRLDIRISTDGDQARIMVMAQGADTRDAIEQALPRLREMLEQSGLQLSRFDVSNGSGSRQGGAGPFAASGDSMDGDGDPAEQAFEAEGRDRVAVAPMSLVDFYV
ncbi:MAG: flagellar hook-length control protein FliK [Halioglobus sp.]|nr:flagellar hook-length control protein FliK [Halioglobus sp.]